MLAKKCDDTWNMPNIKQITPYLERWDYSDTGWWYLKRSKDLPTWFKVTTTSEKKDPKPQPQIYVDA